MFFIVLLSLFFGYFNALSAMPEVHAKSQKSPHSRNNSAKQEKNRLTLLKACSDKSKALEITELIQSSPTEDLLAVNLKEENVAHKAARINFHEALSALLVRKPSTFLAREARFGNMPLHLAAWFGHTKAAEIILRHQKNPDVRNNNGETALMLAAMRGYVAVARILLDHGANANLQDKRENTPLHLTVQGYHYGQQKNRRYMVALLLNYGAHKGTLNEDKKTAAAIAREENCLKLARFIEKFKKQHEFSAYASLDSQ